MAIPVYQEFMLPLVKFAADGGEHTVTEALDRMAEQFRLSEADRDELLPSGAQTRFYNRVTWALTYLYKSRLFDKTGRGRFRIAARGREVLSRNPVRIDQAFLEQFPDFLAFKAGSDGPSAAEDTLVQKESAPPDATPDERLDAASSELRKALADDVLDRVRASTPKFFEHLVVDVLKAMGYGGSHAPEGRVVGRSGDGGIDGVIPEDRLGLDMVYVQAKKWENSVGPDEIRKFVGSLGEQKAHKGVFITSGTFTSGAKQAADKANARVVLIDGKQLAGLMIDHGVGVAHHKTYSVKKLDTDYFEAT